MKKFVKNIKFGLFAGLISGITAVGCMIGIIGFIGVITL